MTEMPIIRVRAVRGTNRFTEVLQKRRQDAMNPRRQLNMDIAIESKTNINLAASGSSYELNVVHCASSKFSGYIAYGSFPTAASHCLTLSYTKDYDEMGRQATGPRRRTYEKKWRRDEFRYEKVDRFMGGELDRVAHRVGVLEVAASLSAGPSSLRMLSKGRGHGRRGSRLGDWLSRSNTCTLLRLDAIEDDDEKDGRTWSCPACGITGPQTWP